MHGYGFDFTVSTVNDLTNGVYAQLLRYILKGYSTETDVPEEMLERLPLFIDMVLIENIVDEVECCAREGEALDWEDIEDAAGCLIQGIPFAGIGQAQ